MCTFFLIGTTWLFKMTSNRRVCVNRPDNFCYICGQYTPKQQCKNITKSIQLAYKYYFDCKLGDQDKEWAPHVCCVPYNSMLSVWMNGKSYMKFSLFYSQEENACFCNDISGLMQEIDCCYDPSKWRLFIDSSKASLKAVLLHNGNEKPLIPVARATGLNGTYEFMDFLLRLTKYKEHTWNICGDLKVVPLLLGLQLGYTKHMCFLCLWNSRDDENHYKRVDWPSRTEHVFGKYNVKHPALIDLQKVLLPPLHIKLGLMKIFVKGMDHRGSGFQYLKKKFKGKLTYAKPEAGVITGSEIRSVINDSSFPVSLNEMELEAWLSFVNVVKKFLGNHKAENHHQLVQNMLKSYERMGCRMSLKMHF